MIHTDRWDRKVTMNTAEKNGLRILKKEIVRKIIGPVKKEKAREKKEQRDKRHITKER
jgi:hypothetical protein